LNKKFKKTRKDSTVAYVNVLSQHFYILTKENRLGVTGLEYEYECRRSLKMAVFQYYYWNELDTVSNFMSGSFLPYTPFRRYGD
jgi:hypothetical protein